MRRIFPDLLIFAAAVGIGVTVVWLVGGFGMEIPTDIRQVEIIQAIPDTAKDDTPEFIFSKISAEEIRDRRSFEFVANNEVVLDDCSQIDYGKGHTLALMKRGKDYSLERVKLEPVRVIKTEFGDYIANRFKDSHNALLIVDGSETLNPGPVQTALINLQLYEDADEPPFMFIGDQQEIKIGNRIWTIRVARGINKTNDKEFPVLVLVVESDGQKQVIWYRGFSEGISDNAGWLEWAGDMDGDGLLDLQQSYYETNGGTQTSILYLSSRAKAGEFVRPYAFFSNRIYHCEK